MERDIAVKKERLPVSQRNLDLATDKAVFAFFLDKLLAADAAAHFKTLRQEIEQCAGPGSRRKDRRLRRRPLRQYAPGRPGIQAENVRRRRQGPGRGRRRLPRPGRQDPARVRRLQPPPKRHRRPLAPAQAPLCRSHDAAAPATTLHYPDANSTLRFSYGRVEGYSPRDAVIYAPFTTLAGVLAKNSGESPFDLDAKFIAAAGGAGPPLATATRPWATSRSIS